MQLVARVEPDAEERVAQPAVDDLLERAADLADVERAVPLRDGLEVRPGEAVDVVAGSPAGSSSASSTTQPARQVSAPQTPNATVSGSPRPIGRSPGLSRPSAARGPAVSIRWHDSGIPFQRSSRTASASVIPGSRPASRRRSAVGGLARRVLEHRELVDVVDDPQAVGRVDQQAVRVARPSPPAPDERTQLVHDERRDLHPRRVARTVFQPSTPTRRPGARSPPPPGCSRSGRDRSRGWLGQAEVLEPLAAHRERRGAGRPVALVADEDRRRVAAGPTTSIASSNRGSNPVRNARFALCSRSA